MAVYYFAKRYDYPLNFLVNALGDDAFKLMPDEEKELMAVLTDNEKEVVYQRYSEHRELEDIRTLTGSDSASSIGTVLHKANIQIKREYTLKHISETTPVALLPFKKATITGLLKNQINTIDKLISYSEKELLELPSIGSRSVKDIKTLLSRTPYMLKKYRSLW